MAGEYCGLRGGLQSRGSLSCRERSRPVAAQGRKHYAWADLLERTFAIDVLACPECGGRLRFLATIEDTPARGFRRAGRAVVEKILRQLDLPVDPPTPAPACVPDLLPGFDSVTE
jgi:hypothetical protein